MSSLLELQARRLANAEAKAAVESSVRRISSIAMVHEHLSLDTTSDVDFDDLVAPLLRMVEEGLAAPAERPLAIRVEGTVGSIDGEVAMPLAVVLVELVQNALQHASVSFPVETVEPGTGGAEPSTGSQPPANWWLLRFRPHCRHLDHERHRQRSGRAGRLLA